MHSFLVAKSLWLSTYRRVWGWYNISTGASQARELSSEGHTGFCYVQCAVRSMNGLPPQGSMCHNVGANHLKHCQSFMLIDCWKRRIYQVEDGRYRNRRASWPVACCPSAAILCSWPWHSDRVVAERYSKRASGGSIDICLSTPFGRC